MSIRRVVTGHSPEGKSIVASDEIVADFVPPMAPGNRFHGVWGADTVCEVPDAGSPPRWVSWFPPAGGFRLFVWTAPPGPVITADAASAGAIAATERLMPGVLAHMEPDAPGYHKSDTTDLLYVASGRIILQLDDGVEVEVKAGDVIVQNGTRHAWRNPGPEPCTIVGFMAGARRKQGR